MLHPRKFDLAVGSMVARLPKWVYPFMYFISTIGGSFYLISGLAITAILIGISQEKTWLPLLLLAVIVSPLAELLKLITRRKRPETIYVENMKLKTYSFPSGHSYISTLMGSYLFTLIGLSMSGLVVWIIGLILAAFAGLIGVSRIYLGAHFPSDVLAGWTLGITVGLFIFTIGGRL